MDAGISYHCPILVTINEGRRNGRRPFRFFDYWMNNRSFKDILNNSWLQDCQGTRMHQVYIKLKLLRPHLKALNLKQYSKITERVMQAKAELSAIQQDIQYNGANEDKRHQELNYKMKYVFLCKDEDAFYMQKSRVT